MPPNSYVISYHALRQLIGILGIALPFLCWGTNAFVNHYDLLNDPLFVDARYSQPYQAGVNLKASISHFYYTAAGPLFTGILITVSIFLFCYKGHEQKPQDDRYAWLSDTRLAMLAACSALGSVVCPTGSESSSWRSSRAYTRCWGCSNAARGCPGRSLTAPQTHIAA